MAVTYSFQQCLDGKQLPSAIKLELQTVLARNIMVPHSRTRKTNSSLSVLTQRLRALNLIAAIDDIINVGKFDITSIHSLKEKHVCFLIDNWMKKNETKGTIENKITYLKTFAEWIGKSSIVKNATDYNQLSTLPARSGVADRDKSWSAAGIDINQKIADIARENGHIAIQLILQLTFGLRKLESNLFRPYEAVREKNGELYIMIEYGPKGGRKRRIKTIDADGLKVIELAQRFVNARTGSTIPEHLTKREWDNKWTYMMRKHGLTKKKLGVTTHGLRHENFNNLFENITGHKSAVRGGDKPPEAIHKLAMTIIAENAGHSRVSKSNAYLGSYRVMKTAQSKSLTDEQIINAIKECDGNRSKAALTLGCARSYLYLRLNEMRTASIAFPPAPPNALSCGVA